MTTNLTIATITCKNGFSWKTEVHGSDESIRDYFLDNYFHTAPFPQECLSIAVAVEIKRISLAVKD